MRVVFPRGCASAGMAVFMASALMAQTKAPQFFPDKNWRQVCSRALRQPFTPPVPIDSAEPKSCDSESSYYGFGHSPDAAAALRCALYQREHTPSSHGDAFVGPGILAMLYANGMGAPRNYDLAIRFACEIPSAADAEMESRVGRLEHLRDTHSTETFDLCLDATSGLMEGSCEYITQQRDDAKRQVELNGIMAHWSEVEKEKFKLLQAAHEEFVHTRSRNEIDRSGTGRAAFELAEQGVLRDQFIINLRRFAAGNVPQANEKTVDGQLNDVYRQLQQEPADFWRLQGTVAAEGIRETERAWIKLRDQWIAFGSTAYPKLSSDRISTELTLLRLHQLRSLLK